MILASNQAGELGSLGGGGGGDRFLSNGVTLGGNWVILFGDRNLSPVTGVFVTSQYPIPNLPLRYPGAALEKKSQERITNLYLILCDS